MPCTCAHVYADQHPGKNRFVGLQSIDDLDIGVVLGLLEIGIHIAGDRHDESLMQTAYNRRIASSSSLFALQAASLDSNSAQ